MKEGIQMKKIVAIVLAAMMLVAAFASCGGSGDSGSKAAQGGDSNSTVSTDTSKTGFDNVVADSDFGDEKAAKLKVWGPDNYTKLLKKQCEDFKKKYPDRVSKIDVVVQTEAEAGTQMLSDAEAGADVFGFANDQLNNLVNAGVIAQIAPKYAADVKATFLSNAVDACTMQNPKTKKDTLYAIPETGNGYFLVYDKSVVSDKDAATFEGILAACKKAGKQFIMDAGNGYYSCMFLFTGGLRLEGLEEDQVTQKFNKYDKKAVVASMKAFSTLMHKYTGTFKSLAVANIPSGFTSTSSRKSTCGAGIDGNWDTASIKQALGKNFGAAKLPTINIGGKDQQIYSMYGYKSLAVNGASKFPRTAQVLAYYLASEKCQNERCTELGWSPTLEASINTDAVKNDVAISALLEQSKYSVAQVNIGKIWDPFGNLGNKLCADNTNPETYNFTELLDKTIENVLDQ
jgi:arabinogalactan oligomer/maltooligosaccharide transport system substrate-binding protein